MIPDTYNQLVIRSATAADSNELQRLSIQLGYDYPLEKLAAKLAKHLNNPAHAIFVAETGNSTRLSGYIHLEEYSMIYADDIANICGIVTDENYRSKGIGKLLLQAGISWAKQRNLSGIRANSSSQRTRAHDFYRTCGFDSEKDQKRFIRHWEK